MKKIFNRNLTRRKSKYELVSKQFGNVVKEEVQFIRRGFLFRN